MLSTFLKSRAASYGFVGASSLLVLASDSDRYEGKEGKGMDVMGGILSY